MKRVGALGISGKKFWRSEGMLFVGLALFLSITTVESQVFVPRNEQTVYGHISDGDENPLVARVEMWREPFVELPDTAVDNLVGVTYSTRLGYYAIDVPVGQFRLRFSKGPEYELWDEVMRVGENQDDGVQKDVTLRHLYELAKQGWYGGDVHLHTIHSDGHNTPSELVVGLKGAGLSWGVLTDHNSTAGGKEWLATAESGFLPILGNEITTEYKPKPGRQGFGHMGQWFINSLYGSDPANPNIWVRCMLSDDGQVQEAVDQTHGQGGLISVNHPFTNWDWAGRFRSWGIVRNLDAMEIWNGEPPLSPTQSFPNDVNRNNVALQIWFELLNAGNRLVAVGGSDCHDIYGVNGWPVGPTYWKTFPGNSMTYVRLDSLASSSLRSSLSRGRAFVTSGFGPLLLVDAEGNGPGDVVRTTGRDSVQFGIRILSNRVLLADSQAIRLVVNGIERLKVPTDGGMVCEKAVNLRFDRDSWVVVLAFGAYPQLAITDPIYIDVPPYGDWDNPSWHQPKEAKEWNTFPQYPRLTISNGPGAGN